MRRSPPDSSGSLSSPCLYYLKRNCHSTGEALDLTTKLSVPAGFRVLGNRLRGLKDTYIAHIGLSHWFCKLETHITLSVSNNAPFVSFATMGAVDGREEVLRVFPTPSQVNIFILTDDQHNSEAQSFGNAFKSGCDGRKVMAQDAAEEHKHVSTTRWHRDAPQSAHPHPAVSCIHKLLRHKRG